MVKGISTVWLPVDDMQRSLRFYGDTLGLSVKQQDSDWAELELDGLVIGLNGRESERPGREGGAVIAFRADASIEDELERLKGEGVDVADGIADRPWGRVAAFHDPDGNVLELYEPPSS